MEFNNDNSSEQKLNSSTEIESLWSKDFTITSISDHTIIKIITNEVSSTLIAVLTEQIETLISEYAEKGTKQEKEVEKKEEKKRREKG